jgi:transcriptional regulator with GAF, ATPase, and Fis domain
MTAEQETRARALAEAFVSLADTLVADYDVIDLLDRLSSDCVALLPVDAAGLLLSDQRGALQVVSSSTEQAHLMELFQVQTQEGPCLDCFRSSQQISAPDLRSRDGRWPRFAQRAQQAGYRAVHALPLRLRFETIGALNLFGIHPGALSPEDLRIGQALADVATIGILQERAIRRRDILAEQLQAALNSRVIIEQAKGILAERGRLDPSQAFALLRGQARSNNVRLSDLARDVITGATTSDALLRPTPPPGP